jgi:hypothetical protein
MFCASCCSRWCAAAGLPAVVALLGAELSYALFSAELSLVSQQGMLAAAASCQCATNLLVCSASVCSTLQMLLRMSSLCMHAAAMFNACAVAVMRKSSLQHLALSSCITFGESLVLLYTDQLVEPEHALWQ